MSDQLSIEARTQLAQLVALKDKVTEEPLDERGRHFVDGNYCDLTQCHHGDTGNYLNREDGQAVALLWNLWKAGALDELAAPAPADRSLVDIERLARSIVTAACELDGPAGPEDPDTIYITMKDLEAVLHRHVTAALETSHEK